MRTIALATAAITLAVGTTSAASASTEPAEATTLSVGYIPALSQAPAFLADSFGFYTDENLSIEWQPIASIADAMLLLAQGDLDVYVGSPAAPMFNSISSGLDVRMIGSLGGIGTPDEYEAPSGVFVRQELLDSGEVSSAADLEGRQIASVGPIGTATSFIISRVLATGDVGLDEVELVPMPLSESLIALTNGAVDAAFLAAPFSTQALGDAIGAPVVDSKEAYGDIVTSGYLVGPSMLIDDRDSAEAFLRANIRATERLVGDYREDAEIVTALAEFMGVEESVVLDSPIYAFDPTLAPHVPTVMEMQDVFLGIPDTLGYTEPLTEEQLFDLDLHQAAVDSLGSTE